MRISKPVAAMLLVAVAVAGGAVYFDRDGVQPMSPVSAPPPGVTGEKAGAIPPKTAHDAGGQIVFSPVTPPSPLMVEYGEAPSLGPLYARLRAQPVRTPEENWVVGQVEMRCGAGRVPDPSAAIVRGSSTTGPLLAQVRDDDPDREAKLAAIRAAGGDRCAGVVLH